MKNKEKYKKIVTWKKKAKWDKIIGGFFFCLAALLVMCLLFYENGPEQIVTLVISLLFIKGVKLILNGGGEGKEENYIKVEEKKNENKI